MPAVFQIWNDFSFMSAPRLKQSVWSFMWRYIYDLSKINYTIPLKQREYNLHGVLILFFLERRSLYYNISLCSCSRKKGFDLIKYFQAYSRWKCWYCRRAWLKIDSMCLLWVRGDLYELENLVNRWQIIWSSYIMLPKVLFNFFLKRHLSNVYHCFS